MGAEGNIDELEASQKLLRTLTDYYCKAYSKKTGLTETDIEKLWKNDCWMGSEEACDKKFIDSISDEEPIEASSLEAIKSIYKNVPTALLPSIQNSTIHQNSENTMDKKMLCVVLALSDTISDAEVMAAISGLKAKADKADDLQNQLNALKAEHDNAKITALMEAAIANKQITAAERPHFEKVAKNDFASAEAIINARPKVTAISSQISNPDSGAKEDRANWKYKDYQEKDPQALVTMAGEDLPKFKKLFKEHYNQEYEG
jgi:hypothetical protein